MHVHYSKLDFLTFVSFFLQGCLYHGCKTCYPDRHIIHPRTKQSVEELLTLTMKKKTALERKGYHYVCCWSHEFQAMLKEDEKMARFVSSLDIQERLDPRDSFFGGRTNASQGGRFHQVCRFQQPLSQPEQIWTLSLWPPGNHHL